jgi:uncharacterized protein YacL
MLASLEQWKAKNDKTRLLRRVFRLYELAWLERDYSSCSQYRLLEKIIQAIKALPQDFLIFLEDGLVLCLIFALLLFLILNIFLIKFLFFLLIIFAYLNHFIHFLISIQDFNRQDLLVFIFPINFTLKIMLIYS